MTDYVTKPELEEALRTHKQELKQELSLEIAVKIAESESRVINQLTEQMRHIETSLLQAFHRYAEVQEVRLKKVESNEGNNSRALEIRLSAVEQDLRDLQLRMQKSGI